MSIGDFLARMHSGGDEVSSKRVYNSIFVLQILVMINAAQFFNRPLDHSVLVLLLTIVTGLSVMTLKGRMNALKAKKDIASDIVNVTKDAETAKEVLQNQQPN